MVNRYPASRRTPWTCRPYPLIPLEALTSYELSRYRRQLEHALKAVPGHDPARAGLQQRLADVQAEQHSRTTITATDGQT
jgi:hypothetical protein